MPLPGTKHFSPAEVLAASEPASEAYVLTKAAAVSRTLEALEQVRALLGGRPLVLTSLVRTVAENASEGGSPTSGHLDGSAADFRVIGLDPGAAMALLSPHVSRLGLDQVIVYRTHLHIGTGPKRRAQLLDKRSGVFTPWTPNASFATPILPDATRTGTAPMSPQDQSPTPKKDNRALIIGAIIAALGGILAWLQRGGAN